MNFWLEVLKITIPALVTIFVVFLGRYLEKQRENEVKIRDKKIQIYEKFISESMKFVLNYSESTEKQKKKLKDELERSLEEFNTNLIFWGSSNIIKKYIQYKIGTKNPNGAIKNYEKFVYALRQDIGQDNKNLKEYDLIKLHLRADQFDEKGDLINT